MMLGAQGRPVPASMRLCRKHAQHGQTLLDSSKLLSGARTCLRGAARKNLNVAATATAQQQGASPVRAGLTMITRHAAAQRSSIARTQATAQKRHVPPEVLLASPEALPAPTMTIGQAPRKTQKQRRRAQKRCSRQPAAGHSSKTTQPRAARSIKSTQPNMLREARAAQQAQSGSKRASTLAQKRSQAAGASSPPECSQAADTPSPRVQRSKAARARAAAQKKPSHAEDVSAVASDGQQAPQCAERRLSRRLTEPAVLRAAARKAELARGKAQRADILLQKRSQDRSASATCGQSDQRAQQQIPMQAENRSAPSAGRQPPCASAAATEVHVTAAGAQGPASSSVEHSAAQGGQPMGSPSMPEQAEGEQALPHNVDTPATPQSHLPAAAEPAGGALHSSPKGEEQPQPRVPAPIQEPGRSRMASATPASHSHSSGRCTSQSSMSSGGPSDTSTEASSSAAAEQPSLSRGTSKPFLAKVPHLSSKENLHPNIPERPAQATAARPASRLGRSSSPAPSPLSGMSPPCANASASACAPSVGCKQHPLSSGATGRATPAQALEDTFHPRRPKRQPAQRPDWREASPEDGHSWLMYKKVLYRREGGAEYQTMSVELPRDKCKQIRPRYGRQSFLQVETKPEDDLTIPFIARLGKHQRDKIIKRNGGVPPTEGHVHYKAYRKLCKTVEKYY